MRKSLIFLMRNFTMKKTPTNKKVVYTCITGNYDNIIEPSFITEGFDYICFTDNSGLTSVNWKIIVINDFPEGLSNVKKQRYVKVNAHKFVSKYDLSIWVDGNIVIKNNLDFFLFHYCNDDSKSIFIPRHPIRDCIYVEGITCEKCGKDTAEHINPQMKRYKEEGFPEKYGLVQTNIMIRKHNSPECIKLMEEWWHEIENGSHRDQLSFNYVLWKEHDNGFMYIDKSTCNSEIFGCCYVHGNHIVSELPKPKTNKNKYIFNINKNKDYSAALAKHSTPPIYNIG